MIHEILSDKKFTDKSLMMDIVREVLETFNKTRALFFGAQINELAVTLYMPYPLSMIVSDLGYSFNDWLQQHFAAVELAEYLFIAFLRLIATWQPNSFNFQGIHSLLWPHLDEQVVSSGFDFLAGRSVLGKIREVSKNHHVVTVEFFSRPGVMMKFFLHKDCSYRQLKNMSYDITCLI